jgi:hypothetical protein
MFSVTCSQQQRQQHASVQRSVPYGAETPVHSGRRLRGRTTKQKQKQKIRVSKPPEFFKKPLGDPGDGAGQFFDWPPDPQFASHLVNRFSLQNSCIVFKNNSRPAPGAAYRSQFVSLDGQIALLHGFSEVPWRFTRVSTVRAALPSELAKLKQNCVWRRLGFAVQFSANNMWHQLHHAPPAWGELRSYQQAHGSLKPMFIPLVSHFAGWGDQVWVKWSSWHVHAWEYTIRALTDLPPEQIAEDLGALLSSPCTCFDHVEGSLGAFAPNSLQPQDRRTMQGWIHAVIHNARRIVQAQRTPHGLPHMWATLEASSRLKQDILYVERTRGNRCISNAQEVNKAVSKIGRLQHVRMEMLPLSEQSAQRAFQSHLSHTHARTRALTNLSLFFA